MPHADDAPISRDPNDVQNLEHHMVALATERETTLTEIRKRYVLNSTASVEGFLFEHHVLPELLLEAEGPLRGAFGADTIFSLRAPIDEFGDQTLYAVAIWPGVARMLGTHSNDSTIHGGWHKRAGHPDI